MVPPAAATHPAPRLAVVYGSTTGCTEDAAERIASALARRLGNGPSCLDLGLVEVPDLQGYDALILGASTWNVGELQADWDARLEEVAALDLRGVPVALFGAGDAVTYPDTFGDAVGIVAERLEAAGARLIGDVPAEGYVFTASRALRAGRLLGLLLDYDNEEARVGERIGSWCERLAGQLVDLASPPPSRHAARPPHG